MIEIEDIINKYELDVIKNIDKENLYKIANFLKSKNCDFITQLLEDYLDLFSFDYDEFVYKFNSLDKKYNYNLLNEIKDNMNILEEFYK